MKMISEIDHNINTNIKSIHLKSIDMKSIHMKSNQINPTFNSTINLCNHSNIIYRSNTNNIDLNRNYLSNHNLYDTDLKRIYWKINSNRNFFIDLTNLLSNKKYYDTQIPQYSIQHKTLKQLSIIILK